MKAPVTNSAIRNRTTRKEYISGVNGAAKLSTAWMAYVHTSTTRRPNLKIEIVNRCYLTRKS